MTRDTKDSKPKQVLRRLLGVAFISVCVLALDGCRVASQSPNPVEFIKDPLGIERGINEYYMPVGKRPSDQPKSVWGSQIQISDDSDYESQQEN